MGPIQLWQLMLVAVVVWLISKLPDERSSWRRLIAELEGRLPVFSAETIAGKEAEFIRDRLPQRLPLRAALLLLAALGVVGGLAWWLLR